MRLSKFVNKILKCKNKYYYDNLRLYKFSGGYILYKIALRITTNTDYVQVLLVPVNIPWDEVDVCSYLDITLYNHKLTTIDRFYSIRQDDYKWLYTLWLKQSKLKIDLHKVTCPIFIIGSKDKDLRTLPFNKEEI
jgi:hypothetical protein